MTSSCKAGLVIFLASVYLCLCMYIRPQPLADPELVCERLCHLKVEARLC